MSHANSDFVQLDFNRSGNHQQPQQPQQYQTIINPNIHTGSIPSTGRSNYVPSNHFSTHNQSDKSVEDTRMIIEQTNRMIGNKCGTIIEDADKGQQVILNTPTSYIDQPMLSAMQQMFNNANTPIHPQTMKPIYHQNTPQQIYFNPL